MNKSDMVNLLYDKVGLTKQDIKKIVDDVFDRIRECVFESEDVLISGFGNFYVKERGSRIGRNPKTGNETVIQPRKFMGFQASKKFKNVLNGKQIL